MRPLPWLGHISWSPPKYSFNPHPFPIPHPSQPLICLLLSFGLFQHFKSIRCVAFETGFLTLYKVLAIHKAVACTSSPCFCWVVFHRMEGPQCAPLLFWSLHKPLVSFSQSGLRKKEGMTQWLVIFFHSVSIAWASTMCLALFYAWRCTGKQSKQHSLPLWDYSSRGSRQAVHLKCIN